MYTYNPSILKAEAGGSPLSSKPASIAQQDQPSHKTKNCQPFGEGFLSIAVPAKNLKVLYALLINAASTLHLCDTKPKYRSMENLLFKVKML